MQLKTSLSPQLISTLRTEFTALARTQNGRSVVYLDGPAGTQTPRCVIDAVSHCLAHTNANHGGLFATSREADAMLARAHAAAADFVGAADPGEISFGANMTSLTFALSRALARAWKPGDEIILTRLDHDANFSPWALAARDAGATVRVVDIHPTNGTLNLEQFHGYLNERTRLVAVGCASNATGGINPVAEICRAAKRAGALVFLDAVHYAPHGLLSVREWNCDFLACSAYKFFGPHVGLMWGRRSLLEALEAYKVRPAPNTLPDKWMTGTQNHEGLAGTLAAIEYLADLGRQVAQNTQLARREALEQSLAAIAGYERELSRQMLAGLTQRPEIRVWGPTDLNRLEDRVPTFSITHAPAELAALLAERGLYVWHGNYHALNLSEALGREPRGMVRVGLVHYNTSDEVERFLATLAELAL